MGKDILVNNGVDYVYFMRLGEAGPIKIGHSVNIKERLAVIQVNNPYLITLLTVVDGGFSKERELHKLFKDHKIYGEWFYPHTDILNYINNLPYLGWISEDLRYHVKKGSEHANWKGDAASLSSKRQRLKAHLRHKKIIFVKDADMAGGWIVFLEMEILIIHHQIMCSYYVEDAVWS